MSQKRSLEESIIDSAINPDIVDLSTEVSEEIMDSFLDDGPIKDIPVLGWVTKVGRGSAHVRNYFFTKKVLKFLFNLKDVSDSERESFQNQLDEDLNFKKKVSEELCIRLDRIDTIEKSELIAKAFVLLIKDKIDFNVFRELSATIDRCFLSDLEYLKTGNVNNIHTDSTIPIRLVSCGLMDIEAVPGIASSNARNRYKMTELGEFFRQFLLQ